MLFLIGLFCYYVISIQVNIIMPIYEVSSSEFHTRIINLPLLCIIIYYLVDIKWKTSVYWIPIYIYLFGSVLLITAPRSHQ